MDLLDDYKDLCTNARIKFLSSVLKLELGSWRRSDTTSDQILKGNFKKDFSKHFDDVFSRSLEQAVSEIKRERLTEMDSERDRWFRYSLYYLNKSLFKYSSFSESLSEDIQRVAMTSSTMAASYLNGRTTIYKHMNVYKQLQQKFTFPKRVLNVVAFDNFQFIESKSNTLVPNNKVKMNVMCVPIVFGFLTGSGYNFKYSRKNELSAEKLQEKVINYLYDSTVKTSSFFKPKNEGGFGFLENLIDFNQIDEDHIMKFIDDIVAYEQEKSLTRVCSSCGSRNQSGAKTCQHCNCKELTTNKVPNPFAPNYKGNRNLHPIRYPFATPEISNPTLESPTVNILGPIDKNPNSLENLTAIYQDVFKGKDGVVCVDGLINILMNPSSNFDGMILMVGYGHVLFRYLYLCARVWDKFIDMEMIMNPTSQRQADYYTNTTDNHLPYILIS